MQSKAALGITKEELKQYFYMTDGKNRPEVICFDEINDEFIGAISDYIIKKYEKPLLLRVIKERYPYITPMQKNYIFSHIEKYNLDEDVGYEVRKKLIFESLKKYADEGKTRLYLDGFVFFRLRQYEYLLEEMAERILEDRLLEQEYEEFVSLLKYFVNMNDTRPDVVNVLVRAAGVYELYSEDGENITKKCLEEFISEEKEITEVNFDDLLISMLITLAPRKIIVHCGDKITNTELFETISKVFDENVVYCGDCLLCKH